MLLSEKKNEILFVANSIRIWCLFLIVFSSIQFKVKLLLTFDLDSSKKTSSLFCLSTSAIFVFLGKRLHAHRRFSFFVCVCVLRERECPNEFSHPQMIGQNVLKIINFSLILYLICFCCCFLIQNLHIFVLCGVMVLFNPLRPL